MIPAQSMKTFGFIYLNVSDIIPEALKIKNPLGQAMEQRE